MQCPNCGTMLPDDARFCPACGTSIAGGEPQVPQPVADQPTAPPSTSGSRAALIIGIVAGVLVLLLACGGIGAFLAYQVFKPRLSTELGDVLVGATSSETSSSLSAGSSTTGDASATTAPQPTNPEPPPTVVTPVQPAPAPAPKPQVSLTEATAIDLVGNYLNDAKEGRSSKARAVTTSRYRSRITSDYYKLAADELQQFEVVNTDKGQGGYLVYVREQWSSGTWTNWYLVLKKNGALVIDDTGTE